MLIWPALLILVSLLCLSSLEYLRQYREASLRWPKTDGRIVEIIDTLPSEGPEALPTVTYEFNVDGKKYHGNRYNYSSRISIDYSYDEYLEFCKRYRRGSTVTVSYDPKDPKRCCLFPGHVHEYEFARDYVVMLVVGAVGVVAQIASFF